VEYAKLETACLAHVDDNYYFGAYCRKCGRQAIERRKFHFPMVGSGKPIPSNPLASQRPPQIGDHARLSLVKLRAQLGDDYPVRMIRDRLRCERCSDRRQIVITFLAPDQRTGESRAHIRADASPMILSQ
jgi:hypothetical protein